jgi:adenylate kinase family enzyme
MKNLEFPIIGTKVKGITNNFDIESPAGRKKYFQAKAGDEIIQIRKYLKSKSFIAYFLGKKSAGKGTYSKLFTEIFSGGKAVHLSVGDLIREVDDWKSFIKTKKYVRMKSYYRGYVSFDDAVKTHLERSISKLLPTEFILALMKAHIDELQGKSIFIDGLPRNLDQISYSLFFRDVINYRDDPDIFILIDIPEAVIAERMKYRVVCPKCQTSRNLVLLPTSKVEYDTESKVFYLVCDNTSCKGVRMDAKEGDEKGLEFIRERLDRDEELIKETFKLYGIPKILLRNHIPASERGKFDKYEITPKFEYNLSKKGKVKVKQTPWVIKDDNGVDSHSLMAPAVIVSMLKQMVEVLDL